MRTYKLINQSINFIAKQIENLDENDDNNLEKLKILIGKLRFEQSELNKWYLESIKNVKKTQK